MRVHDMLAWDVRRTIWLSVAHVNEGGTRYPLAPMLLLLHLGRWQLERGRLSGEV